MKADLLALLTSKSPSFETRSANHDAITSEDISHFLGTRGLDSNEYNFLIAKYTDNSFSKGLVFDGIYEDVCDIFMKHISPDDIKENKCPISSFVNLALRETIITTCPFCQGRGVNKNKNSIDKCYHCKGSGQFIYDDDNRPEFLGIDKEEYKKFKKPYMETLEFVKNIEINALAKIGDDSNYDR